MFKKLLVGSLAILGAVLPFACSTTAGSSSRDQSCSSTGECKAGLICKAQVCVQNDYPVDTLTKVCTAVECAADADCCTDDRLSANCQYYKDQCAQQGGGGAPPFGLDYCQMFDDQCKCTDTCVDQQCRPAPVTCTSDADCGFGLDVCDTASGECVACLTDDDCNTTDGEKCTSAKTCQAPCTVNEDCPLFSACTDGECKAAGCADDRDCILASGKADSVCVKVDGSDMKECQIPCEVNSDCQGDLEVCQEGTCVFLGCENDEQCRAYLHIDDNYPVTPKPIAKCVDPKTATK